MLITLDMDSFDQAFENRGDHIKGKINNQPGVSITWDGNTHKTLKKNIKTGNICGSEGISNLDGGQKVSLLRGATNAVKAMIGYADNIKTLE